jgi:ligand-binding sensor domain-containing protein
LESAGRILRSAIHEITQTKDGYLWIGTLTRPLRFDGVRFVPWKPAGGNKLSSARITALLGASDGSLWIGEAKKKVKALIESFGLAVIDLGNLRDGGLFQQPGGPLAGLYLYERGEH